MSDLCGSDTLAGALIAAESALESEIAKALAACGG